MSISVRHTLHTLTPETTLEPADIPLDSPGDELLCLGMFKATVKYNNCFKWLSLGISSAFENLQGLESMEEVFMDVILLLGDLMELYNIQLKKALQCSKLAVLKLNKVKWSLMQSQLHFLGHLNDQSEFICKLSSPMNVQELKRVLGIVDYLGRYIHSLSTVGQLLYELLKAIIHGLGTIHKSQP